MDTFATFKITDISAPAADACCSGGCCCGPADTVTDAGAGKDTPAAGPSATATTVLVDGMTCSHCVAAVTKELTAIDGVDHVDIQLVPGGPSTVTIATSAPVSQEAIAEAIGEAGYTINQ